jgi:hypothetical protein
VPVTTRKGVAYLHFLPDFKNEVVWKHAPRPGKAVLLRTGQPLTYSYQDSTLRIELPPAQRTDSVDVVRLDF